MPDDNSESSSPTLAEALAAIARLERRVGELERKIEPSAIADAMKRHDRRHGRRS